MRSMLTARLLMGVLVLAAVAVISGSGTAADAAENDLKGASSRTAHVGIDVNIDDNEDDVLEVQLLVLGIVVCTVFVLGTGAYLLRRKLGLTAYTPADSGHH